MYKLMKLPYPFDGLSPDINQQTVTIHYTKHHKKYVDNLNEALKYSNLHYSLKNIPKHIDEYPLPDRGTILYNAGGVLNHDLYWYSMNVNPSYPKGKLLDKIKSQYGSFEQFKNIFVDRAKHLVGSGYTFLVTNENGELTIMNLVNQETPISYNLIPLFTIDLWEHAYYLQYQNNRDEYINNFWNKANFDYASKEYENIVNKKQ